MQHDTPRGRRGLRFISVRASPAGKRALRPGEPADRIGLGSLAGQSHRGWTGLGLIALRRDQLPLAVARFDSAFAVRNGRDDWLEHRIAIPGFTRENGVVLREGLGETRRPRVGAPERDTPFEILGFLHDVAPKSGRGWSKTIRPDMKQPGA